MHDYDSNVKSRARKNTVYKCLRCEESVYDENLCFQVLLSGVQLLIVCRHEKTELTMYTCSTVFRSAFSKTIDR
jgi:hypothetical protein